MIRHLVVLTFFFFFAVRYVSGEERLASSTCQYLKNVGYTLRFFFIYIYNIMETKKKILSSKITYLTTLKKVQVDLNVDWNLLGSLFQSRHRSEGDAPTQQRNICLIIKERIKLQTDRSNVHKSRFVFS